MLRPTMKYEITSEEKPSDDDLSVLARGIDDNVLKSFPIKSVGELTFFLRDEAGEVLGGVSGNYGSFGWLYVDSLWVTEELRGHGYGKRLLDAIEAAAAKAGCKNVYLQTFSFQAPEFYKKQGYTVFAELEDFPTVHSRLFLRKALRI